MKTVTKPSTTETPEAELEANPTEDAEAPPQELLDTANATVATSPLAVEVKAPKSAMISEPLMLEPPVAVRPPFAPDSDEAGQLINELRSRAALSSELDRRRSEREDVLELILDDFRVEQAKSAKICQRILGATSQSMQTVDEARRTTLAERNAIQESQEEFQRRMNGEIQKLRREKELADEELQTLRRDKETAALSAEDAMKAARSDNDLLKKQLDELSKPAAMGDTSGAAGQNGNLKKIANVLDGMPAENSAKILQQMVKDQKIEAVVVLLNAMKPRMSSKVLSTISDEDAELAADLTERLKRFKLEGDTSGGQTK